MRWWRRRPGATSKRLARQEAKRLEREDAKRWVDEVIARLRGHGYAELVLLVDEPVHEEMTSRTGRLLIREWEVFWDGRPGEDLRVVADVWDPSKGVSFGMEPQSFIKAPDDSFVGE